MFFELTFSDVIILPITLLVIGALTYLEAFVRGKDKEQLPKYRWIGIIFVALATMRGAIWFWQIINPFFDGQIYRSTLTSKKIVYGHYISFFFPLAGLVGIILLEKWFKRYQSALE